MKSQKISNEQIKELIRESEALEQQLPQAIACSLEEHKQDVNKRSVFSKLLVPLILLAFVFSAYYLYEQNQSEGFPLEGLTNKESLLSKKLSLMRTAPTSFIELETSLKELSQGREEKLAEASSKLSSILKNNQEGPLEDFYFKFDAAASLYQKSELEQKEIISSEFMSLWDEIKPSTKQEVELFKVLIHELKLQPYISEDLLEKIKKATPLPNIKIQMKELHATISRKKPD